MKIALVYILLIATLLPTVSQWGTIAYYHANKDYIARVLCENRDKPQLHCDGKCYLAKQLKAQQERQDKDMTARLQDLPIITLFCSDISTFLMMPPSMRLLVNQLPVYQLPDYRAPLVSLFQPPQL
ncbi:hypothetical protein EXU85_05165 [Spirosoma sp. KCTC 42546]|uniref:hypothetical protein n=1 Tax=Spirosoma sp. KCTC 42546 TaxID=2520506 RepID=UPI00115B4EED|nr:hypothetical protein [Spirosoma sp. KCTC 42546]QDK78011.1 hypothetical protein EXU85_05165 [Spirosoma sp. KCTC 42546]